jgi:hypothetical protein
MLTNGTKRGFTPERLQELEDPKVGRDPRGYYVFTLSEDVKVHFDDFYRFLEKSEKRCLETLQELEEKIRSSPPEKGETLAYLRAKKIVTERLLDSIYRHYREDTNLGFVMSAWCFGTVVLERVEIYRGKLSKGQIHDPNIPDYPYFVLRYIDEIYKVVLLDLLEFPEKAFSMRWQYTELLKRYSKVLSKVTTSLHNVVMFFKMCGM